MTPQEYLYWLRNWLTYAKTWREDWSEKQINAEIDKIVKQETNAVAPAYGPAARIEDRPYYPQVYDYYTQFTRATAPEPTTPSVTGYYKIETTGGYSFAILRDDAGNVVDTINLGKAEEGGITPYQQAQLDYNNQQLAQEQQQWQAQMAYQQQQAAQQQAYQQAQLQQQAALQQAQMQQEAQLAGLPYGQMTAYQLATAQQDYQQYLAEMMANPSRWIEAYYGQQQPQPWYMGLTPTAPTINVPSVSAAQIPQVPPTTPIAGVTPSRGATPGASSYLESLSAANDTARDTYSALLKSLQVAEGRENKPISGLSASAQAQLKAAKAKITTTQAAWSAQAKVEGI